MAKAKVTVVRNKKSKRTLSKVKKSDNKKGNPNHCPTCGKFWNKKS